MDKRKAAAAAWFRELRNSICDAFEEIEREMDSAACFTRTPWDRAEDPDSPLKGGGEIALMKGTVFEKVGVNISEVHGTFSEEFRAKIPGAVESDGAFWAAGISLVAHMCNPHVPAVHMNTRMIATSKCWFGGGADLTPMFFDTHRQDGDDFRAAFENCCNRHPDVADFDHFKKWCDEYFFLPHRNEPRGLGGIFYDYLETDWDRTFAFTQDVGQTFTQIYPEIVRRHMHRDWTTEDRDHQLHRRGRYVEFNLLYDRGTQFGLKTGGNTEAILMSMPPEVKWD